MSEQHRQLWSRFCDRHNVRGTWVELFETSSEGVVLTKRIGSKTPRLVLRRSDAMEALVRSECSKLIADWKAKAGAYDGLIYVMATEDDDQVVPLYIGKAETLGKGDGNLSANLKGVDRDTSKFARWGDNYAYHIGDLSAVVLSGHDPKHVHPKYEAWANTLFKTHPTDAPVLKRPVYFWTKAWSLTETGVSKEFDSTRLTFLEYLLIGVASSAFGASLLNREGRHRE